MAFHVCLQPDNAVSWQVTGIRQDLFARSDRVPVEVAKSPREISEYQNPEAYAWVLNAV